MIPAVIWGVIEVAAIAITAYELYDLSKTLYDGVGDFTRNKEKAKEYARELIKNLQDEFNLDIDETAERQLLATYASADLKTQSEVTRNATGRSSQQGTLIQTAIKMPIPFRKEISSVCDQADKVPVISLRRKRSVQIKDLPHAKKEILIQLLALSAEQLADVDLDAFIVVRLKQLMTSFIFEFVDEMFEWQSPMKSEACFGPAQKFDDPPSEGGTRLKRVGTDINPFYPLPHRQRGSMAMDLAIPDYRKEPLSKTNLFAIVEIKFQGDSIKNEQFEKYEDLSDACSEAKTAHIGKSNTLGGKGVTKGTRVALFRYPEDKAIDHHDEDKDDQKQKPSHTTRRKKGL